MCVKAEHLVPRFVAKMEYPYTVEKKAMEFLHSKGDMLEGRAPDGVAAVAIIAGCEKTPFTGRELLEKNELEYITGAALRTINGLLLFLKTKEK